MYPSDSVPLFWPGGSSGGRCAILFIPVLGCHSMSLGPQSFGANEFLINSKGPSTPLYGTVVGYFVRMLLYYTLLLGGGIVAIYTFLPCCYIYLEQWYEAHTMGLSFKLSYNNLLSSFMQQQRKV